VSGLPPPPPTGGSTSEPAVDRPEEGGVVLLDPPPRRGELTSPWRIVTALTWVGVVLAFAAVWNASVQLGLSTWWLGPRGDPQPRVIQLIPFVAPLLMVLGTINNARWLGWHGLAASGVLVAVGIGDLGRVGSIAVTELAIAGAAAAVSLASLTGTYRAPADRPTTARLDPPSTRSLPLSGAPSRPGAEETT
jgi:hypothetical protein